MSNTQTRCNTRKKTSMSSPTWYMHLFYGISLPLQMCMRNRISPLKNEYKSHIEMTKTLRYTL